MISSRKQSYRALREAAIEMERAEENRKRVIAQYIYLGPVGLGQPIPQAPRVITVDAVKEISDAEDVCKSAEKRFEEALNRYRRVM
jgi:hypothetical protein